jgi:S-adenosylmethionine:tRNA ribosyltransferase-isomerase
MLTTDFDYPLPKELIAQAPAMPRDSCRLLVLDRGSGRVEHRVFTDILEYLTPQDLMIVNETKVFPARLLGHKKDSGGEAEVFLLEQIKNYRETTPGSAEPRQNHPLEKGESTSQDLSEYWTALVKPGRRLKPGAEVMVGTDLSIKVLDWVSVEGHESRGERVVELRSQEGRMVSEALHAAGHVPLPPYITQYQGPDEMYQTVYAKEETSAAAPTAGLHFTPELIERIKAAGVGWETIELQVGIDTFRSVDEENIEDHQMHTETYTVPQRVVDRIAATKAAGGRVVAVGTTCVRSLESAFNTQTGQLEAKQNARTALYITPGYHYNVVDALVTNFHVPKSTLMMLVSAFATREQILAAYQEAIDRRYRFLSFGDAMLII